MQFIKEFLKFIGKIIIAMAIVGVSFFAYYEYKIANLENIRNFSDLLHFGKKAELENRVAPAPENPRSIRFNWEYAGKQYSVQETLYASTYDFYQSATKEFLYDGELASNWEEQYLNMFLQEKDGEKIFHQIATDIRASGKKNGLNDDQIVELVLAFVQAIDYDDSKAASITAGSKTSLTSYPYETLYLQKGVCADKSFLAVMLLRDLGYGTALFTYDAENHMALGIQCSKQYSSYGSGYCYAETTASGIRIGMIPDLNKSSNQAKIKQRINHFDYDQSDKFDEKKLGAVRIFQKTSGREYGGIVNTMKISQDIESIGKSIVKMRTELTVLKSSIDNDQAALDALKEKMRKLEKAKDFESYNDLVPTYNSQLGVAKKNIEKYNAQVKTYNSSVDKYNDLIESF